jgi:hypothetical protein
MPKYVANPRITAMAGGLNDTALWVATEDGSIFRLIPTVNPQSAVPPSRDPSMLWEWEKIPALPTSVPPAS